MLTVAALVAFVIYSVVGINTELNEDEDFKHWKTHDGKVPPDIWSDAITINLACVAGSVAGLIMAFFWIMAAKACPSPVVYISLYAIPVLSILGALPWCVRAKLE